MRKLKDTKAMDAHASPRSPFSGAFLIAAASMAVVIALAGSAYLSSSMPSNLRYSDSSSKMSA